MAQAPARQRMDGGEREHRQERRGDEALEVRLRDDEERSGEHDGGDGADAETALQSERRAAR